MKKPILALALLAGWTGLAAQPSQDAALREAVRKYFTGYRVPGYRPAGPMLADSLRADAEGRRLAVYANEAFSSQPLTPQTVKRILSGLGRQLPPPYDTYSLTVYGKGGRTLEELVPNFLREEGEDSSRLWGGIDHEGRPWVENLSRPYEVTRGLAGRHLFLSPSHGRYYGQGEWRWQRPALFCTREDLFTQSFVLPFLIPMLENAGAVVCCSRERDMQTAECVADNDAADGPSVYEETDTPDFPWRTVPGSAGFAPPAAATYADSLSPFRLGTARYVAATSRRSRLSTATWKPCIPKAGRYAVYVSYAAHPDNVDDARYTVHHKGGSTLFRVNQRMGGGTWVYLGTFDFDAGPGGTGRVTLTNESDCPGVVTADGVRFGGGMGQTPRGEAGTSGTPRFLEAARYHAQWAGLPDSLYRRDPSDDYADDIRSRPYLLNHLGGGSCYLPAETGKRAPFEVSLALHSDAGFRADRGIYGTLAICTTRDAAGRGRYPSGLSRAASSDLAALLLASVSRDLGAAFRTSWTRRELWDRNYGETRLPDVPSAILEMLSHQNFTDMRFGHDPTFKFVMARAVYKALLRFVNGQHGIRRFDVQPLPVRGFSAILSPDGKSVRLSWEAVADSLEESATPTGYVVYTRVDGEGFDNGRLVKGRTAVTLPVAEGRQYGFRVSAVNKGGESFPSETLSVYKAPGERHRILVVNGFERLSGPAWVDTPDSLGFDLERDPGVPYLRTAAFCGRQLCFDPAAAGETGEGALGHSDDSLEGRVIAGNTFDYPFLHGQAIAAAGGYSFSSCSKQAFVGLEELERYRAIDYIAGLERDVPWNLRPCKALPADVRRRLAAYLRGGGRLFLSGSHVGADLQTGEERVFAETVLKYRHAGTEAPVRPADGTEAPYHIDGLNLKIPVQRTLSAERYAATSPDVLYPACPQAFPAFAYASGRCAGIAYPGADYRVIATGFPFECVTEASVRDQAMKAILLFLTE